MSNTPTERRQQRLARQAERLRCLNYYASQHNGWALDGREAFERDELRETIARAQVAQMRREGTSGVQLGLKVA